MITAIIQARSGSTRLPGKVLKEIQGESLLAHVIRRVEAIKQIDKIVIATTTDSKDNGIIEIADRCKVAYSRGSENDVLERFYEAAKKFHSETIVRITADCPLIDPAVADQVISCFLKGGFDYVSNTLTPTFPDGLDVEVFSFAALEKAFREAKKTSEREHVTPYIWGNPALFKAANYLNKTDLSELRWTVDTPADFEFIKTVYQHLYQPGKIFLLNDVLQLLSQKPEIETLNSGQTRNEGYAASLAKEKQS